MKKARFVSFLGSLIFASALCSAQQAQAPSHPNSSTQKKPGVCNTVPGHGFPVKPTLEDLVENYTRPENRVGFLACVAMQEDRYLSGRVEYLEDEVNAIRSKSGSQVDPRISALLSKVDEIDAQVSGLQAQKANQNQGEIDSLRTEVRTLQSDLESTRHTVTSLCSAIKFSLAMNGSSATPTGAELWNACK